jgi:hypothetical protein
MRAARVQAVDTAGVPQVGEPVHFLRRGDDPSRQLGSVVAAQLCWNG